MEARRILYVTIVASLLAASSVEGQRTDPTRPATKKELKGVILNRPSFAEDRQTALAIVVWSLWGSGTVESFALSPLWVNRFPNESVVFAWWTAEPQVTQGRWTITGPFGSGSNSIREPTSDRPLASGNSTVSSGASRYFLIPYYIIAWKTLPEGAEYRVVVQPLDARKQPVGKPSNFVIITYKPLLAQR